MTELIHCKFFLSLLLLVRSEVEFINVSPFLLHWEDCYVNLILYKPVDFFSRIPIVATTPLNDIYVNDTQCKPVDMPRGRRGSRYNFNINPNMHPRYEELLEQGDQLRRGYGRVSRC